MSKTIVSSKSLYLALLEGNANRLLVEPESISGQGDATLTIFNNGAAPNKLLSVFCRSEFEFQFSNTDQFFLFRDFVKNLPEQPIEIEDGEKLSIKAIMQF